jgi:hypothetical protein
VIAGCSRAPATSPNSPGIGGNRGPSQPMLGVVLLEDFSTRHGTDMYVSGTMNPSWNNDVLNPAFHSLTADDFEVVQLGWGQPTTGIP